MRELFFGGVDDVFSGVKNWMYEFRGVKFEVFIDFMKCISDFFLEGVK